MTVAVQTNRNVYNGDGVTLAFNFNFYCVDPAWVHVTVDHLPALHVASVVLNTDQSVSPGGIVHFAPGFPPDAGTGNVIIQRAVPLTQLFNYQYLDAFPAVSHMGALDKLTAVTQDLAYQLSLIALPSYDIANALQYLQVNALGTGLQWNDPIPKPYVPGYVLGALDPTTLAWVPGGGGGGGGIILGAFDTTPNADGLSLTGLSSNILHLSAGDQTHPGGVSTTAQTFGGVKKFPDGAAVTVFDVRDFGAVKDDPTNDLAVAYYAALAKINTGAYQPPFGSYQTNGNPVGCIYIPQGTWYTSKPLLVTSNVKVKGDGKALTFIVPGSDSGVAKFSGPVFYATGMISPAYLSTVTPMYPFGPALGGGTRSLHFTTALAPIPLHDCYAWSWFLGMMIDSLDMGFRFEYQLNTVPLAGEYKILGTEGPDFVYADNHRDRAFCVKLVSDGTHAQIKVYFTTSPDWTVGTFQMGPGVQVSVTSGNIAVGSPLAVEFDFDGTEIWLYINGVHQAHTPTAGGPIYKVPWEGAVLGTDNDLEPENTQAAFLVVDSYLGCMQFRKLHFHAGTGSFTPVFGPYTADANTLWLCNWDQTDFPVAPTGPNHLPFLVAQAAVPTIPNNGPTAPPLSSPTLAPHYLRTVGGRFNVFPEVEDLFINCAQRTAGFTGYSSPNTEIRRITSSLACYTAFKLTDGESFYSKSFDCIASAPSDFGFRWYNNVHSPYTLGCPVGVQLVGGGICTEHYAQPNFASWCDMLCGPGNSKQSLFTVRQFNNDAEGWAYLRKIGPIAFYSVSGSLVMDNCILAANQSSAAPAVFLGAMSGHIVSTGDSWQPGPPGAGGIGSTTPFSGSPCAYVDNPFGTVPAPGEASVTIYNPTGYVDPFNPTIPFHLPVTPLPYSTTPGTVTVKAAAGSSNQKTLSAADSLGFNLSGTFVIEHGFTWGRATFVTPEPDANFDVWVQFKGYTGSAPAAGSTIPGRITISSDGSYFDMDTGVDPGGTCVLTFSYLIVRNDGGPLLFEPIVATPTSHSNPFLPDNPNALPWAIGFTVSPAAGDVFVWDSAQLVETILNLGSTPMDGHWITISFDAAANNFGGFITGNQFFHTFPVNLNPLNQTTDRNSGKNKLMNIASPGSHNIVVQMRTAQQCFIWVDGGLAVIINFGPGFTPTAAWAGFTGLMYQGKLYDGTLPLARATLTDFKMDRQYQKCITFNQSQGPGRQGINTMIGDEWLLGKGSSSAFGGFGSQIAQNKYGTNYYYMAAFDKMPLTTIIDWGLADYVWPLWGQWLNFQSAVVLAGWHDLLHDYGTAPTTGASAASTFTALQGILEGDKALQTWHPPTTNQYAWCSIYTANPTFSTFTGTIGGFPYTVTWLGDKDTSFIAAAALMNADPNISALVTAVFTTGSTGNFIKLNAKAPGSAGNGILVTVTGDGASYSGVPPAGGTFDGVDCTLTIRGVVFVANFITDAATTCNTVVNAINTSLNPLINGVVTAANVANTVVVTAVAPGRAANDYTFVTNGIGGAFNGAHTFDPEASTLKGGQDGLLNKVPNIFLCTVPPFGTTNPYYTAGKETQRQAYNTSIRNWVTAHAGAGAVLCDVDLIVKDGPGTSLNPAYDNGAGYLNDAGQTAVYAVLQPLLP